MKLILPIILSTTLVCSCYSDRTSYTSPVYDNIASLNNTSNGQTGLVQKFTHKSGIVFHASELSTQVTSFPKFENSAVNQEVNNLKFYVKEYLYAIQEHNIVGQDTALTKLQKSYRKIQKLRKYLKPSEDEVMNRYLVRLKTQISHLEALQPSVDSLNQKP